MAPGESAEEDVGFRVDAIGRDLTGKEKGVAAGRVGMDARAETRRLHHGDVDSHFARCGAAAAELAGLKVNQADVVNLHEAFGTERRRTEDEILRHPD